MTAIERNNVKVVGSGERTMMFAHGFGCDQNMWRHVAPAFEGDFKTVVFDNLGAGGSDLSAYDPIRHASLAGYADDLIEMIVGRRLEDLYPDPPTAGQTRGSPPTCRQSAASATPFDSGIDAGPPGVPGARSSSPVQTIATRGRRATISSPRSSDAASGLR